MQPQVSKLNSQLDSTQRLMSSNNNSAAGEARLVKAAKEFQRRCKGNLQDLDDSAFAPSSTRSPWSSILKS